MRNLKRDNQGQASIVGILMILILVLAMAGMHAMQQSAYIFEETQSIIDHCVLSTLQASIDGEQLGKERLCLKNFDVNYADEETVEKASIGFWGENENGIDKEIVTDILRTNFNHYFQQKNNSKNFIGENDHLSYAEVKNFEGELFYDDWGINIQTEDKTYKKVPQVALNVVMELHLKVSGETFPNLSQVIYQYSNARNGTDIKIKGRDAKNNLVIIVRSYARYNPF